MSPGRRLDRVRITGHDKRYFTPDNRSALYRRWQPANHFIPGQGIFFQLCAQDHKTGLNPLISQTISCISRLVSHMKDRNDNYITGGQNG